MVELRSNAEYGKMLKKILHDSDSDLKGDIIFELIRIYDYKVPGFAEIFKKELGIETTDEKVANVLRKLAEDMHKNRIKEKDKKELNKREQNAKK